jgi:asparagine synthase (glutamine-hydrolysing)
MGWAHWGDGLLDRIEGMFSFALVDERRGRALLARDRLGIKPLYWADTPRGLVAASAPRAILAMLPALRNNIDAIALAQFLSLLWIPHPRTPWLQIRKLAPGEAISFSGDRRKRWRYWSPPAEGDDSIEPNALLEVIRSATRAQLLSDVPLSLLLSGGLDSSLLLELIDDGTCAFGAVGGGYSLSANSFELSPDDSEYVRIAAAGHPAVKLLEVELGGPSEADPGTLSWHMDDPVADPAAMSLRRLASESGRKVLISGVGAEELFGGYPRHSRLAIARRAAGLPFGARRALAQGARALHGGQPGAFYSSRRNAEKLARATSGRGPIHYWRMMAQLDPSHLSRLIPSSATAAVEELDSISPSMETITTAGALQFDREQFLPNLNLAYVDKAAMAVGVEVRVPFLDERVVEMVCGARQASLVDSKQTKRPLREAARGLVPQSIISRRKSGFGGPIRAWLRDASIGTALRGRCDALADTGLVEREAVNSIFRRTVLGKEDLALECWALACLQAWHEAHVG